MLVLIGSQPVGEFIGQGLRRCWRVVVPLGAEHAVEVVMVDGLFFVAADGVDEFDQCAGEHLAASLTSCCWACSRLVSPGSVPWAGRPVRRALASMLSASMASNSLLTSWVSRCRRRLRGSALVVGVELLVEPREAAGEGADGVVIVAPIITPMARSLSGTVGLVISGWLAVLSDLVTPMASTMT